MQHPKAPKGGGGGLVAEQGFSGGLRLTRLSLVKVETKEIVGTKSSPPLPPGYGGVGGRFVPYICQGGRPMRPRHYSPAPWATLGTNSQQAGKIIPPCLLSCSLPPASCLPASLRPSKAKKRY